ncbi:MAG: hypothetical protein ABI743_11140, partial [bacterium]
PGGESMLQSITYHGELTATSKEDGRQFWGKATIIHDPSARISVTVNLEGAKADFPTSDLAELLGGDVQGESMLFGRASRCRFWDLQLTCGDGEVVIKSAEVTTHPNWLLPTGIIGSEVELSALNAIWMSNTSLPPKSWLAPLIGICSHPYFAPFHQYPEWRTIKHVDFVCGTEHAELRVEWASEEEDKRVDPAGAPSPEVSVMKGNIPSDWTQDQLLGFLWSMPGILGFGIGIVPMMPWIEILAGPCGMVIYRAHGVSRSPDRRRRGAFEDLQMGEFASFLSAASGMVVKPPLIFRSLCIAMRHFFESITSDMIETRLFHLFRGLEFAMDAMLKHEGIDAASTQSVAFTQTQLAQNQQAQEIIDQADSALRLCGAASVADSIKSATQGRAKFVRSLMLVISRTGWGDQRIADPVFAHGGFPQVNTWIDAAVQLRNQTMHADTSNTTSDLHTLLRDRLYRHLMDLFARIVLRTVGYSGDYYVLDGGGSTEPVDWTASVQMAERLGYPSDSALHIAHSNSIP